MIESKRFAGIDISLIRQVIGLAGPHAINLALGELGYALPKFLQEKAHELLDSGTAVYTPNAGLPELRESLAEYYADQTQAGQICVTNGAEEAVFLTLMVIADPGTVIAIPDPDYAAYPAIVRILGCPIQRLPFDPDLMGIDWTAWAELLARSDSRILLVSNPQNPSGKYFSYDELNTLATICNRLGIILVVDEIYRELYADAAIPQPGAGFDNIIRIGGLSKSHCMSGWRLGWVNAPAEITATITKGKQYVSTCAHWLSQKLAVAALSPLGMEAQAGIRERFRRDRMTAAELLSGISEACFLHVPQAGPYLMLQTPLRGQETAAMLAQQGVIAVPGSAFGMVSQNWIRLNFAVPEPDLLQGFQTLKASINFYFGR